MKVKHKRLTIGIASIASIDLAGFVTMIANPDLTERVIPALAAVQIFGFVAIAAIIVMGKRDYTLGGEDGSESGATGKLWVPWLFGFIALLSFMRAGLALVYIAGEEGHKHSWFGSIAGTVMGCFFLWLAILAGRSAPRRKSREKISGL